MAVSPIRETLTAPWGTVNGVALDNNSCQARPLPSPGLLLQAEKEDERRGRREEEESSAAAASFSLLKVSSAAINLGLGLRRAKKLLRKVII